MNTAPLLLRTLILAALIAPLASCGKSPHPPQTATQEQPPASCEQQPAAAVITAEAGQGEETSTCLDPQAIKASERNRANCYHLQPGTTVVVKKEHRKPGHSAKTAQKKGKTAVGKKSSTAKQKGKQKHGTAKATKATSVKEEYRTTTGMCQPQSLIYARCRTGIKTCTLGNTSPVQWFACAKRNGATTSTPTAGSVLVLDSNASRRMHTGHPVYVEEVKDNKNGTWTLRISHTNYDRKCHLDLDATVLYDPKHMTASFQSGPWAPWGKHLKALGFILR